MRVRTSGGQCTRFELVTGGYVRAMPSVDEQEVIGVDEQLGSPWLTFEAGWLFGVLIGFLIVVMAGRRRKRHLQKSVESHNL